MASSRTRKPARDLDVVLFGATGFTGGLTADYLAEHAPAGLRWALAGRSLDKLERVREDLATRHPAAADLELIVADAADRAALDVVAGRAKVVATTVGPYLQFGEPLVAACAAAGTDYVDLTGEPEFVDRMWLAHHEAAQASGARIVHACGFDSIPHDLGAYFTVQQVGSRFGTEVPIALRGVVRSTGTFSGGTFHSAMGAFSRARQMQATLKERRRAEPRPEGRRVRGVAPRLLAAPLADHRPAGRHTQRRRAARVRTVVHLLPLRRHQDAAVRRRRDGRGRRAGRRRAGAAGAQPAPRAGQAGRRAR
jgi:short subunit dehydrogenase-like uncharacterized protein